MVLLEHCFAEFGTPNWTDEKLVKLLTRYRKNVEAEFKKSLQEKQKASAPKQKPRPRAKVRKKPKR